MLFTDALNREDFFLIHESLYLTHSSYAKSLTRELSNGLFIGARRFIDARNSVFSISFLSGVL